MANKADRRMLGWWLAGLLVFFMSAHAGALDLDREISRHNETSSQISGTLGRDRGSIKVKSRDLPSLDEEDLVDDYKVELIPAKRDKSS